MRLEGKVALISGAARGMGAAEARLFAREGASVGIADVLEEEGRRLEEQITEAGGQAFFLRLDVTSDSDWDGAVDAVVSRFGKLDVLVNNAGVYHLAVVEDTTPDSWDRVMEVNAKGVFLGTRAAIPAMREAGGGSIVNISSTNAMVGTLGGTAYNASKGAVRVFTKSTAVQYGKDGIRANSVHPGPIQAPMLKVAFPDPAMLAARVAEVPLGRVGTAEEVASCVLFLASDESSYVTGSELAVDGGWLAQ